MRETGSSQQSYGDSTITIAGTKEECDLVRSMLLGVRWLRCSKTGEAQTVESYDEIPPPGEDPDIPPQWTVKVPPVGQATEADLEKATRERIKMSVNVGPMHLPDASWHYPSFYLTHPAAGGGSYREEARKLFAFGFECLRSRRGADGKFWEVWYLPGKWRAQGPLADAIKTAGDDWLKITDAVVGWMCRNVNFGTLNVAIQQAALVYE